MPVGPLVGFNVIVGVAYAPCIVIDPTINMMKTNITRDIAFRFRFDFPEINNFSTTTCNLFDNFSFMVKLN